MLKASWNLIVAVAKLFNSLVDLALWSTFNYWVWTHPAKFEYIWRWLWN